MFESVNMLKLQNRINFLGIQTKFDQESNARKSEESFTQCNTKITKTYHITFSNQYINQFDFNHLKVPFNKQNTPTNKIKKNHKIN